MPLVDQEEETQMRQANAMERGVELLEAIRQELSWIGIALFCLMIVQCAK